MTYRIPTGPRRIVCLTEEPTEILYLLGESERIVGISAYTVRPPEAKRDKPVVSAFIGGSVPKICALEPDLIIGFSDIQAELARELIAANQQVLIFNQRSIQEILEVIVDLGSLVHRREQAQELVGAYVRQIEATQNRVAGRQQPRVYFEEWDDPMICGIRWVSELIGIAGGIDVFADRAKGSSARERTVTVEEVAAQRPDLMLASWCGKPLDRGTVGRRFRNDPIPALQNAGLFEIPPEIVLQPGPACLTDGLSHLENLFATWSTNDHR